MGVELKTPAAWRKSMIAGLLSGQRRDGGFGVHPNSKWKGSHRRLVSLVELGVPRTSRDWRRHGASNVEAVDWGDAHQMVTPIALGIVG